MTDPDVTTTKALGSRRRGRPPTMIPKRRICSTIAPEAFAALRARARANDRSISDELSRMILAARDE